MVASEIDEGKPLADIARAHPAQYIRYGKGIANYAFLLQQGHYLRDKPRKVYVFLGETGTGKSLAAISFGGYKPEEIFVKPVGTKMWMCGYTNQKVGVFDEVIKDCMPVQDFMRAMDNYNCALECKGGHVFWVADVLIITSNFHPKFWWTWRDALGHGSMTDATYAALCRRIASVTHFARSPANEYTQNVITGEALKSYLAE